MLHATSHYSPLLSDKISNKSFSPVYNDVRIFDPCFFFVHNNSRNFSSVICHGKFMNTLITSHYNQLINNNDIIMMRRHFRSFIQLIYLGQCNILIYTVI